MMREVSDDSAQRGAGLALAAIGAFVGLAATILIGVVVALEIGIGIGLAQQRLRPVDTMDTPALFDMGQFPHTGTLWQYTAIGAVLLGWIGVALARRSGELARPSVPRAIGLPLAIATVGAAVTYADALGATAWLVTRVADARAQVDPDGSDITGLAVIVASVPVAAWLFRFTR